MTTELANQRIGVPQRAWLVLGDVAVFGLFALTGRRSHQAAAPLLDILTIAAPFALGWLAVAPWLGLYRSAIAGALPNVLRRVAVAWAVAGPLGLLLRATLWSRTVPLSFAITTLLINLLLLLGWRSAAAWWLGRR